MKVLVRVDDYTQDPIASREVIVSIEKRVGISLNKVQSGFDRVAGIMEKIGASELLVKMIDGLEKRILGDKHAAFHDSRDMGLDGMLVS